MMSSADGIERDAVFRQILQIGVFLFKEVKDGSEFGKRIEEYCAKRRKQNAQRRKAQNEQPANLGASPIPTTTLAITRSAATLRTESGKQDIVDLLNSILSQSEQPFKKRITFNSHDVEISYDPVARKTYPMQFRSPGRQTVSSPIGVYELNERLQKFFGRLLDDSSQVPMIAMG